MTFDSAEVQRLAQFLLDRQTHLGPDRESTWEFEREAWDDFPAAAKLLKQMHARISELEAARIAYASEFPLNANGDPDVGSIHANIRKLKAQLIAEAKKTASEKLRADQMTEQHRMQAKMHAEATEEIVRLKTVAGTSAFRPTENALQIKGLRQENAKDLPTPTPWYPDDSGEWVEVPESLMGMPKELKPDDLIEVLLVSEREDKVWWAGSRTAESWGWRSPFAYDSRIVAYKVVKP